MTTARIYKPTKTAMQSGTQKTKHWLLTFNPKDHMFKDPIMGWTGSTDTLKQVNLKFETLEEALLFSSQNNLTPKVEEPHVPKRRPKMYADNFKYLKTE